jgi:two-component system LytT family sensor kinase
MRHMRLKTSTPDHQNGDFRSLNSRPQWLVWAASFAVWTLIAFADTFTAYQFNRATGRPSNFLSTLGLQFAQFLPYAPLSPLIFGLATLYPVQRSNWVRRSFLHLAAAFVFSVAHTTITSLAHSMAWDWHIRGWVARIGESRPYLFGLQWPMFESLFFYNVVDDIVGVYVPIALIAHVATYYRRLREREVHTSQLEAQLANAHLQALKAQLQPHFLFNTLHSISALMLTDVDSADRMITRLSDLLRMSLENDGSQITTLSRELEFVNGYLEIEKIRFADRLTVHLDIDPETLDAQVPHLLLQPLIENAVRHGVSRLSSGGEIRIAARHDDRKLHLQIRNNGPGLAESVVERSRVGLGLGVARERLQTLYGNEQSFEIHDMAGGGVEVRLSIPFLASRV